MKLRSLEQINTDYAEFLSSPKPNNREWNQAWADLLTEKHATTRLPTIEELARAFSYITGQYYTVDGKIRADMWIHGLAFGQNCSIDADDVHQAQFASTQLTAAEWLRYTVAADRLACEQRGAARFGISKHL